MKKGLKIIKMSLDTYEEEMEDSWVRGSDNAWHNICLCLKSGKTVQEYTNGHAKKGNQWGDLAIALGQENEMKKPNKEEDNGH